jgi:hypothetical protein
MLMYWAQLMVWAIVSLIALWAFVDCVFRPAAAFPAVERQTKSMWLLFTALAVVVIVLLGNFLGILGYMAVIVSAFYLADVRGKVIAITRR